MGPIPRRSGFTEPRGEVGIREKGGDSRAKHYRKFESNRGREVLTGSDKAFSKVFFFKRLYFRSDPSRITEENKEIFNK